MVIQVHGMTHITKSSQLSAYKEITMYLTKKNMAKPSTRVLYITE